MRVQTRRSRRTRNTRERARLEGAVPSPRRHTTTRNAHPSRASATSLRLAHADIAAPGGEPHAPSSSAPALALVSTAGHAPAAPARIRARMAHRQSGAGARWARLRATLARWVGAASEGAWGWVYRVSMVAIAAALVWALWRIQEVTGAGGTMLYTGAWWHRGLRWLELLWLAPTPLAAALWAGWLIWAEAARHDPRPRSAPLVSVLVDGPAIARMPARLVFRFVTRGEQLEALQASLEAARAAMRAMPPAPGAQARSGGSALYRIEIVSDRPLPSLVAPDCAVYAIPADYQTAAHSRFKARALTYLQKASPAAGDEWRLYLDEESRVDPAVVAGIYDFIERAEREAARGGPEARRRIGQGAMLYEGGPAFFRAADALRTGDDLGRFRLQYGLGAPIFGAHGSFLLVRGMDEPRLSFDVGARNSITEDAAWALHAWGRGWRFGWVAGYVREQPPQSVMDFVRQRARWLSGVRLVALDRAIPLGCRVTLLTFVALWQLSFVPLLVTLVALATHTPPIAWMRLPADITWATFALAYLQGLDTQAARAARERAWPGPAWLRPLWLLWARAREWMLGLGIFWYSLLEMFAVIYSLRRDGDFHVIRKPRVTEPIGARSDAARGTLSPDEREVGAHA